MTIKQKTTDKQKEWKGFIKRPLTYIFIQLCNIVARSCCMRYLDSSPVSLVLIGNCLQEMYVLFSITSTYTPRDLALYDITYLVPCIWPLLNKFAPLCISYVWDRRGCPDLISRDANKVLLLQLVPPLSYPWLEYTFTSTFVALSSESTANLPGD